jgi:hypothetical protein
MAKNDLRVGLKNLAGHQLPEFIQAEYPTFVSFVEAYYEYLDSQDVDITSIRDIDKTLDDYIKFFKAELAHNYPVVSNDANTERFLLKHIKEQYLAKGSEASYKLLFRLLYGKDVFIDYPGRMMLRVSDGRWTQDVSIFVLVSQGNPYDLIGKTASIQTGQKIYNTEVVANASVVTGVTASIQNVVVVDEVKKIYEIFLDRNFYGDISPFNSIKYGSEFSGTILPCTAKIKINDAGKNFRPGMVFQLQTGDGTPFWFKVSTVNANGGLKTIDTIKYGLFYNTSFSITVLPNSAVTTKKKRTTAVSDLTYTVEGNGKVVAYTVLNGGLNYTQVPTVEITGNGTGATAHAVLTDGVVTSIVVDTFGQNYTTAFARIINAEDDVTGSGATLKAILGSDYTYSFKDKVDGFTESGYVNSGDYWDSTEHGRSAAISAASIRDGVITDIEVTSPGSGYTEATVVITDSTGSGTTADAIIEGGHITGIVIDTFGYNYTNPTIEITGDGSGAEVEATVRDGCITQLNVTNQGVGYDLSSPVIDINIPQQSGVNIDGARKATAIPIVSGGHITGSKITYPGYGYVTLPLIKVYGSYGYANGGYVGTIARQFFINAADTLGSDPAILNVSLEAVAKYPGYYKTNDGFLDDSMMIQDSYYFQAFAYVLKIDEQLQSYASVVRSMLHPSGMAMFGEYSINNKISLSIGLNSLVKSLGVTLYDTVLATDGPWELDENGVVVRGSIFSFYKDLSTTYSDFTEIVKYSFVKSFGNAIPWPTQSQINGDSSTTGFSTYVESGMFMKAGLRRYLVTQTGNITATEPTHTSGTATNGTAILSYVGSEKSSNSSANQYIDFVSKIWTANTAVTTGSVLYYENRKYVAKTTGVTSNTPPDASNTQTNGTVSLQYIGVDVSINTGTQTATYTEMVGHPDHSAYQTEIFTKVFGKSIGATGSAESVFPSELLTISFSKYVEDTTALTETYLRHLTTKAITDSQSISDLDQIGLSVTLNTILDPLTEWNTESGYVVLNPYDEGSYQAETYSNAKDATFST